MKSQRLNKESMNLLNQLEVDIPKLSNLDLLDQRYKIKYDIEFLKQNGMLNMVNKFDILRFNMLNQELSKRLISCSFLKERLPYAS